MTEPSQVRSLTERPPARHRHIDVLVCNASAPFRLPVSGGLNHPCRADGVLPPRGRRDPGAASRLRPASPERFDLSLRFT